MVAVGILLAIVAGVLDAYVFLFVTIVPGEGVHPTVDLAVLVGMAVVGAVLTALAWVVLIAGFEQQAQPR